MFSVYKLCVIPISSLKIARRNNFYNSVVWEVRGKEFGPQVIF